MCAHISFNNTKHLTISVNEIFVYISFANKRIESVDFVCARARGRVNGTGLFGTAVSRV